METKTDLKPVSVVVDRADDFGVYFQVWDVAMTKREECMHSVLDLCGRDDIRITSFSTDGARIARVDGSLTLRGYLCALSVNETHCTQLVHERAMATADQYEELCEQLRDLQQRIKILRVASTVMLEATTGASFRAINNLLK